MISYLIWLKTSSNGQSYTRTWVYIASARGKKETSTVLQHCLFDTFISFSWIYRQGWEGNLPWTMRCTFVDFGFLFVRIEQTYGPSSWTSTFWILMLYSVTAVFSMRMTRGSKDHFSFPANRMVVRLSHATRDTLLSTLHLVERNKQNYALDIWPTT